MNHMLYLPYDFHTTIISLTSSLLPGPCSQEGRTGAFSWRLIRRFLILFSVKREVRKLFFVTRDLKVLRDPRRTWTFNRYSWFHHSILGDFGDASPPNGRTTVAKSQSRTTALRHGKLQLLSLPFDVLCELFHLWISREMTTGTCI